MKWIASFLIIVCGFISCKSAYPVYKQFIDDEVNYYGAQPKDTILYVSDPAFLMLKCGLLSTQVDSLYFIGGTTSHYYYGRSFTGFRSVVTDRYFENASYNMKSSHPAWMGGIGMRTENFVTASLKADRAVITNFLYYIDSVESVIPVIRKALKEEGILIVVQEQFKPAKDFLRKSNLPDCNEESFTKYFEERGFKKVKSFKSKSSYHSGFMGMGDNYDLIQIHFKKA